MKAKALACVIAGLLAGCDAREGGERVGGVAQPRPAVERAAEPAPAGAPLAEPVTVTVAASLRSDRRLMVTGTTNLPETTRLQVVVERELSGVRWSARTTVLEGNFSAGPLGPGSGLPDGGYVVRVTLPPAGVQPVAVRQRIGERGEHLRGPLVGASPHGLGQIITQVQRLLVGSEPRRTRDRVEVLEVESRPGE